MVGQKARSRHHFWAGVFVAAWALMSAPSAMAACRVTDFTTTPLTSLNEVQRLSFVRQMTRTEYERLRQTPAGDANHYDVITSSPDYAAARQAAQSRLEGLQVQNVDDYATIWASDYLNDEQLRAFLSCTSMRRPGIAFAGRPVNRNTFNLSFVHLTPIGIEKIGLRLVASHNVRNVAQIERFLEGLGEQDQYTAQTLPISIIDRNERAVLVLRAGWETPRFIYIPAYPWPDMQ